MSRATILTTLVLGVLAACGPPMASGPGGFDPGEKQNRFWIEDTQVNTCSGETVHLNGEVHIVIKDPGSSQQVHVNAHLTGRGSFGNDYNLNLQADSAATGQPPAVELQTRTLLVSKGSAPNQLSIVNLRTEPFVFTVESECRG